jgi:hypothetical protein
MRRLWLLVVVVGAAACFSTPQERCGFLCGAGSECPMDYECVAADNRCHLIENGAPVASCNEIDAPIPLADAPFRIDAPLAIDAPRLIDAPPGTPDARIDARPALIDAPPMIDAP